MTTRIFVFLMATTAFLSCTMDDENRCLKGLTWDPDVLACREKGDTESATDTATETDFDGGSDTDDDGGVSTDTDPATDELPQGMGETCTANGNECASYPVANYCAYDFTKPEEPGICTIKDCNPGQCPTQYQCCDCMSIIVTCIPDDDVPTAVNQGCTCI